MAQVNACRPVVGVICEYDPFHRGHARQFALIRERLPHALIVCVMSGCFTQRGAPALFAPGFRAGRALASGADAVLELPAAFAVSDAEGFALGGVRLLDALGFVTHLRMGGRRERVTALLTLVRMRRMLRVVAVRERVTALPTRRRCLTRSVRRRGFCISPTRRLRPISPPRLLRVSRLPPPRAARWQSAFHARRGYLPSPTASLRCAICARCCRPAA